MESFFERIDKKPHAIWKTVHAYNINTPDISKGDSATVYLTDMKDGSYRLAMKVFSSQWMYDNEEMLINELNAFDLFSPLGISIKNYCHPLRTPNNIYLPLELCNAGSLDLYLKQKKKFPEEIIKNIAMFLGKSLSVIHEKGCIHREINPKHILVHIGEDGKPIYKLTGFQFFKNITKKKPSSFVGSVAYNAPETVGEKEYDFSADIWSVGVTLYELATGQQPQSEDPHFVPNLRRGSPLFYPEGVAVHPALKDLIRRCLEFNPKERISPKLIATHGFITGDDIPKPIVKPSPVPLPPPAKKPEETKKEEEKRKPEAPIKAIPKAKIDPISPSKLLELCKTDFHKYMEHVIASSGKEEKLKAVKKLTLDPYIVEAKAMCRGGFSEIYKCKHKETGDTFVLKKVLTSKMVDLKVASLLLGEIEVMIDMRHSPFTITLEDYFVYENNLCLILEYCNGGDLDNYVRKVSRTEKKILPVEELKLVAWNVGCGLRDMHAKMMMHRDIKPKNILLIKDKEDSDGKTDAKVIDIKLCDYGLSRQNANEERFEGSTILGTFDYFAPELHERMEKLMAGEEDPPKYTNKVDVWSYGILLYFIAYGKTPLEAPGGKTKVLKQKIIEFPEKPGIPADYIQVMKRALEFNPSLRPSFTELLHLPFFTVVAIPRRTSLSPYKMGPQIAESTNGKNKIHTCTKGKDTLAVKMIPEAGVDMKRLIGEIDTMVKLRNGNNVITLIDHFIFKNMVYLVMDLYTGGNLEAFIFNNEKQKRYLSSDQQIFIAHQILRGLQEIHGRQIVHRDMHPKNILVKTDAAKITIMEAVIADFGNGKSLLEGDKATTVLGTYKPPELYTPIYGLGHDSKGDIWAYGMILYFIMFGIHYSDYIPNVIKEVNTKGIVKYPTDRPSIVQELIDIMNLCITPDPRKRPTASDLLLMPIFMTHQDGS